VEGQVYEVLMELDVRERVGLQDVWCQDIEELHAKALRIEHNVLVVLSARTAVIWWDLNPQLAVLDVVIVVEHEEAVPFDDLPG